MNTDCRRAILPSRTRGGLHGRAGARRAVRSLRRLRRSSAFLEQGPCLGFDGDAAAFPRFADRRTADRVLMQNEPFVRQKIPAFKRTILPREPQGRLEIVGNVREIPFVPARLQQHAPEIKSAGPKPAEPFGGDARHQVAVRAVAAVDHHADVAAAGRIPALEDLDSVVMDQGVRMSNRIHFRANQQFAMMSKPARGHHV